MVVVLQMGKLRYVRGVKIIWPLSVHSEVVTELNENSRILTCCSIFA